MDKRRNCSARAISPLFQNIFNIYFQLRGQITCSFVKFVCSIGIFFNSANLIYRSMDISKCFKGSLRLRDNESLLYSILQGIQLKLLSGSVSEGPFDFEITRVYCILYYKVYNSNCYQVGHDLIDHAHCNDASMPEYEALPLSHKMYL